MLWVLEHKSQTYVRTKTAWGDTFGFMDNFRDMFAARLSDLLTEKGLERKGRQVWLVRQFLWRKHPITQGAVNKWLSGLAVPDTDKLVVLADIFEVSLDFLVTGRDSGANSAGSPEADSVLTLMQTMTPEQRRQMAAIAGAFHTPPAKGNGTSTD
jgi:transcriptional regulator with XRE-family HTH domain